jgi:hypothetical protein
MAEGAEVAEPAEEITQEPVADKVETVKAETPKPSIKPRPQSWSADLDDWWNSLPPERQDFLSKREGDSTRKSRSWVRKQRLPRSSQPSLIATVR